MRAELGGMAPGKPLRKELASYDPASRRPIPMMELEQWWLVLTGHRSRSHWSRNQGTVSFMTWSLGIEDCRNGPGKSYAVMSRVAFSPTFIWVTPSSQPGLHGLC